MRTDVYEVNLPFPSCLCILLWTVWCLELWQPSCDQEEGDKSREGREADPENWYHQTTGSLWNLLALYSSYVIINPNAEMLKPLLVRYYLLPKAPWLRQAPTWPWTSWERPTVLRFVWRSLLQTWQTGRMIAEDGTGSVVENPWPRNRATTQECQDSLLPHLFPRLPPQLVVPTCLSWENLERKQMKKPQSQDIRSTP